MSSPEVVKIANDKYLTYQFLKQNGLEYPASCIPNGKYDRSNELDELISNVGRYLEEITYARNQLKASVQSDSFVKNAPDNL